MLWFRDMDRYIFICCCSYMQFVVAQELSTVIVFTAQPEQTSIVLGDDLTLNCTAQASSSTDPTRSTIIPDTIQYQWLFKDEDIASSLPKALLFQNHSLFVPRVREADLGEYECVVWLADSPEKLHRSGAVTVIETYLEEFYLNPESNDLFENNTTVLQCVTGYTAPPAELHWQKDGLIFHHGTQEISRFGVVAAGGAVQQTMTLQFSAQVEYNGTYRCVARNPLNNHTKKSQPAHIKIQAPMRLPYIIESLPSHLLLTGGAPYLFASPIRGWPLPHIKWYTDGKPVQNTDRINIMENGSLYFDPVLRSDAGRYACIGSNLLGSVATLSTSISVAYLDVNFKQDPSDTNVVAGQAIKLPCQPPDFYPNVSIIWYKNTEPITPRTGLYPVSISENNSLVFDNVQMNDSATYYCVALNQLAFPQSRTSNGAKLTVEGSPQIQEPPTDLTVVKGDLLTLPCQVRGYPQPTIAWYKDGELLLPNTRIIMRDWGQELLVADTNILDEGHYRCLADNIHGQATSHLVFVDIIVPPEVTGVLTDMTVAEGENVVLKCGYYGDPVPTITWLKDGAEVSVVPGSGFIQMTDGLDITVVKREDEGEYICQGENTGGHKQQHAHLYVQVGPQFIAYPDNKVVNMSQAVIFYCEATGDPQPSVSWKINGSNVIPAGIRVSNDVSTLIIQSVQLLHSGNYTCVAENVQGQVEKTSMLFVQEKPMIQEISGSTTINQGSVLDLYCNVKGQPQPVVTWSHNDLVIDVTLNTRVALQEGGMRLVVQFVSSSDSGDYVCMSQNAAGVASHMVQVFVRETPLPPFLDRALPVSKSSINVTWIPVVQTSYTQLLYYMLQYKTVKQLNFITFRDDIAGNLTHIEVEELDAATEYVFKIAGRNIVGTGDYSRVIGNKTLVSAPGRVRNLKLVSDTGRSLVLSWEVPAQSNGQIHQYQLQYKQQGSTQGFLVKMIESPNIPLQTYTLESLMPYTTYLVRVRTANLEHDNILWGDFAEVLTLTTSMQAPTSPPVNVLLTSVSSSSVNIQWQPVPLEFQNGALLGYMVYYRLADTTDPMTEQPTGPLVHEVAITGLLPWRYYQVSVAALNAAGVGLQSQSQRVRTQPQAPKGFPQDVKTEVMSSTSVKLSWKELSLDDRQSEISGYLVWFRNNATNQSHSQYVPDPNKLDTVLSNLVPWTVYSIQLQAFTTQLENGFGPLSIEQRIQTKQDFPGIVSDLKVIARSHDVILSWQPPTHPNGLITGYRIQINQQQSEPTKLRTREKRSIIHFNPDDSAQSFDLSALDTSVTLDKLSPEMSYWLAIAAKTIIGHGRFDNISVATPAVTEAPVPVPVTTDRAVDTTSIGSLGTTITDAPITQVDLERDVVVLTTVTTASGTSMSRTELIGIVVGSVAGALFVIVLLILFLVICCRKINDSASSYIYSDSSQSATDSSGTNTATNKHRDSRQQFNNRRPPDAVDNIAPYVTSHTPYPHSSSTTSRHKQTKINPATYGGHRHHTGPTTVHDYQARPNIDTPGVFSITQPPMYAPFSTDSLPTATDVPRYTYGYDNQGYLDENNLNESRARPRGRPVAPPRHNVPYTSNVDLMPNLTTRHSKRMQRTTAAAIAAQRNRESTVFHDLPDTENLIDDSVIIYNERTAL